MTNNEIAHNNMPVYNIKAVSQMTGLLPVTLRAWERRYGMPNPQRGEQGYRLYSEEDLKTLQWLKAQVDAGMSISRAVQYLNELRESGKNPLQALPPKPVDQLSTIIQFRQELLNAVMLFDESAATEILRRAFSLYAVDQVLLNIVKPIQIELGEKWHSGEIPVAIEHFSTQFFLQHLMSMISASAPPTRNGTIIAACAPGEVHQVGLLMIVVLLRWHGWDVKYLGPNLKIDRLEEALDHLHPKMLLMTATLTESAKSLEPLSAIIEKFSSPRPMIVLGGLAFKDYKLSSKLPVIYLNSSLNEIVSTIENLMQASENKN